LKPWLQKIAHQQALSQEEAEAAMHVLLRGEASPEETAGLLLGLRARGETLDELTGFTRVMRQYAVSVVVEDPHALDIVGTGGDGAGTVNLSTAAALVCAGAGVTVAKHGNRAVSSQAGAADVLAALGVQVNVGKHGVETCLREVGLAFLFAPNFHPAVRHVMPVRRALGVRTFFNILGPLCNPASVRHHLVGGFSTSVAQQMAAILHRLGAAHVLSVHAADGLDEIALSGETVVFEARSGMDAPARRTVTPEQHGLARQPLATLRGGAAEENAATLRALLDGQPGPVRDAVLLNAAWALYATDRFPDLDACLAAARESLDSGAARHKLHALIRVSNAVPVAV
jgi:anthranilate phosphoribosyltransferase